VRLRAQFDKTFVDMNPPDLAALPGLFFRAESRKKLVLLSITFFARRNELWGRFLTTSVQIRFLEKPIWTAKHRRFSQAAADNAFKAPPARRSMLSCLRNGAPLTRPQFGQHLMERANLLFRFGRSLRGIKDLGCPIAVVPRQFGQQWFLTCGGLSIRLPHLYAPATPLENRHPCLPLCTTTHHILRAPRRFSRQPPC